MTKDDVMQAVQSHNFGIITRIAAEAPPALSEEIERALPQWDNSSRRLAALCLARYTGEKAGQVLLRMTADQSTQVATAAATGLLEVKDAAVPEAILAEIAKRESPQVRALLYRAVGRGATLETPETLEVVRLIASGEGDAYAAEFALATLVKLGGVPERATFLEQVRTAGPDEAMRIQEHLLYIGDRALAKALLGWLEDERSVFRLGNDQDEEMARMCDIAVWTIHLLKIAFVMQPDYRMANYDTGVRSRAAAALRGLPDVP